MTFVDVACFAPRPREHSSPIGKGLSTREAETDSRLQAMPAASTPLSHPRPTVQSHLHRTLPPPLIQRTQRQETQSRSLNRCHPPSWVDRLVIRPRIGQGLHPQHHSPLRAGRLVGSGSDWPEFSSSTSSGTDSCSQHSGLGHSHSIWRSYVLQ